jgi:hypothetical protein
MLNVSLPEIGRCRSRDPFPEQGAGVQQDDDRPTERIVSCAFWEFCLLPIVLLVAMGVIFLITHRH